MLNILKSNFGKDSNHSTLKLFPKAFPQNSSVIYNLIGTLQDLPM